MTYVGNSLMMHDTEVEFLSVGCPAFSHFLIVYLAAGVASGVDRSCRTVWDSAT
jgi:hypothetical protein